MPWFFRQDKKSSNPASKDVVRTYLDLEYLVPNSIMYHADLTQTAASSILNVLRWKRANHLRLSSQSPSFQQCVRGILRFDVATEPRALRALTHCQDANDFKYWPESGDRYRVAPLCVDRFVLLKVLRLSGPRSTRFEGMHTVDDD